MWPLIRLNVKMLVPVVVLTMLVWMAATIDSDVLARGRMSTAATISFAGDEMNDAQEESVRHLLKSLRSAIFRYSEDHGHHPDLFAHGWSELLLAGYLWTRPANSLQDGSTIVCPAAAPACGWVWRNSGNGSFQLYAVAANGSELP